MSPTGDSKPTDGQTPNWPSLKRVAGVTLATTALVTAISHAWPRNFAPSLAGVKLPLDANSLVGATFLGVTWFVVLRRNDIGQFGLSLGGLTEPKPIEWPKLIRSLVTACGWALLLGLVCFPPFWFGYRWFWGVKSSYVFVLPSDFADRAIGQLLVIALPEEAFFRGYLQSALEHHWRSKQLRILGAELGLGTVVAAAVFAVGHVLTIPSPFRLGVFVPALLFGWLRARTKGIGASVLFHAMCNLYSLTIATGYGLA